MKKILFALLITVAFISCEGPMGPMGPPGENANETLWDEDTFDVRDDQWTLFDDGDERYFFHERDWNAITDFVVDRGIVVGYIYKGANDEYFSLPYIAHRFDGFEYTETVSYSFSPGKFTIIVKYLDFSDGEPRGTMRFRLAVIQ